MGWKHEETKDLIWDAIKAIKDGRIEDAITTLEMAGRPKWHSSTHAAQRYAEGKVKALAKAEVAYSEAMSVEGQ